MFGACKISLVVVTLLVAATQLIAVLKLSLLAPVRHFGSVL